MAPYVCDSYDSTRGMSCESKTLPARLGTRGMLRPGLYLATLLLPKLKIPVKPQNTVGSAHQKAKDWDMLSLKHEFLSS
ncbi:hypothetical protein Y1Q_0016278 [Alligator mississippiensis]|uniref:Uncharacterized protein n=1 Tax=Alligator mississippiensis TaxID=8496 RepID=A0A151M454_ALLMI|nr:hypothetical protein Y1Q_0016278 [Alligator mississippiensis]